MKITLIFPIIRKKLAREHIPLAISKRRNITSIIYYHSSNPCPPFVSRAPPKLRSMGLEADRSRGVTGIISMSRILMSVRRWRQLVLISGTHLPQLRLVSTATLQPSRFRHDVRPMRAFGKVTVISTSLRNFNSGTHKVDLVPYSSLFQFLLYILSIF